MNFISSLVANFKKLDKFSISIICFGILLSAGLLLIGYIFTCFIGRIGDAMTAYACARGAFDAAPQVAVFCLAGGLICDLAVRDKKASQ